MSLSWGLEQVNCSEFDVPDLASLFVLSLTFGCERVICVTFVCLVRVVVMTGDAGYSSKTFLRMCGERNSQRDHRNDASSVGNPGILGPLKLVSSACAIRNHRRGGRVRITVRF